MTYDAQKNAKESYDVAVAECRRRNEAKQIPAKRVEVIGDCTLFLGDCLEILPTLGKVDAVVTDPPYGVGFNYESHDDSRDGYEAWCGLWFSALRIVSERIAISCGIANLQIWPKPDWTLCWHKPASMGRCHVGFNNWEPVILYGRAPRQIVDVFKATIVPDATLDGHPCPKPLGWGVALVGALSSEDETILDPFMGSGTTGVACAKLGRKFIGIEIEPKYFDIACKRISDAYKQGDMFIERPKPPTQEAMI